MLRIVAPAAWPVAVHSRFVRTVVTIAVNTPDSGPSNAPATATVTIEKTAAEAPRAGSRIRYPTAYRATERMTPPISRRGRRHVRGRNRARGAGADAR